MSLCSLCRSIPFNSLPALPMAWRYTSSISNNGALFQFQKRYNSTQNKPIGFSHHESLVKLAASAAHCRICDLIYSSVKTFIISFCETMDDPSEECNSERYLRMFPLHFHLWLTKCLKRADGFLILVRGQTENDLFLVGVVGFCVEESMI